MGQAGLLPTPVALGVIPGTWPCHHIHSLSGCRCGRVGAGWGCGGSGDARFTHMRLTSAPADLVRQVTPPAKTPQNGAVLGRGIDGLSNEEGNAKVAKADRGQDRVKNSLSRSHAHSTGTAHTRAQSEREALTRCSAGPRAPPTPRHQSHRDGQSQ